jgi:pimeloyl-ACP methyl ester carboxylesterase
MSTPSATRWEGVEDRGVSTGSFEAALAYRERGHGEPVIFVHGSSSDLRTWEHQLVAANRDQAERGDQ